MPLVRQVELQNRTRLRRSNTSGPRSIEYAPGAYRGAGSERFIVWLPGSRSNRAARPPVVYCHGFLGGGKDAGIGITYQQVKAFLDADFPVIAADLGGASTWGNDDSLAAVDQAITYANTQQGLGTARVAFFAQSMGMCTALLWAARNPSRTVFVYGQSPVVGLANLRANPTAEAAFGAAIDAAYGGNAAYLAALPTHDCSASGQTTVLLGLRERIRIDASLNDEYMLDAQYSAFVGQCIDADYRAYPGNHGAGAYRDPATVSRWAADIVERYS